MGIARLARRSVYGSLVLGVLALTGGVYLVVEILWFGLSPVGSGVNGYYRGWSVVSVMLIAAGVLALANAVTVWRYTKTG